LSLEVEEPKVAVELVDVTHEAVCQPVTSLGQQRTPTSGAVWSAASDWV
jgi:hypothetical protein